MQEQLVTALSQQVEALTSQEARTNPENGWYQRLPWCGSHAGPSGHPAPCLHCVLGIPELAFEKVCLGVVTACWETAAAASDTSLPHLGCFVVVLKGTIGIAQAPAWWCLHPKTDVRAVGASQDSIPRAISPEH